MTACMLYFFCVEKNISEAKMIREKMFNLSMHYSSYIILYADNDAIF